MARPNGPEVREGGGFRCAGGLPLSDLPSVRGHAGGVRRLQGVRAAIPRLPMLPVDHLPRADRERGHPGGGAALSEERQGAELDVDRRPRGSKSADINPSSLRLVIDIFVGCRCEGNCRLCAPLFRLPPLRGELPSQGGRDGLRAARVGRRGDDLAVEDPQQGERSAQR